MSEALLFLILGVVIVTALLVLILLLRSGSGYQGPTHDVRDELRAAREESRTAGKELREELSHIMNANLDKIARGMELEAKTQQEKLDSLAKNFNDLTISNKDALHGILVTFNDLVKQLQGGNEKHLVEMRTTVQEKLESLIQQSKELTDSSRSSMDRIQSMLDVRVKELQESNEKKLEEMRKTVDEKLHDTLEKRLGDSFKFVSDRLEAVHKGLGEMQTLASGVGDLKRVLSNVKVRGTWAEVQLGTLLEEVLAPSQYQRNVAVRKDATERVEYAVRLPGPKSDPESPVWLPIDSKFPQEDYLRLQDASERGDSTAVQEAAESLVRAIKKSAKDISSKYVEPPQTTDFGIMFLATEGLYAEVLRHPSLSEELRRDYRIILAGPTTLVATLCSLRMGFQTIAIEQQASEAWRVLGAVKAEFQKFAEVLDKVKKQLNAASSTIEKTEVRTRAIQQKLRSVEEMPARETLALLPLSNGGHIDGDDFAIELELEE